ncbi:hypothetical protein Htur_1915 [Haloterrigena turkmenica DSM 5511]|uniref:Uncharacterized protein n=1 Tax=Haloterrigena turkmenica (strain ATCC 51198 / DSM 5511 / JCM 9101 / NCIMB 13204 / VKM B-1734 / 4k) TaxID=543526 RepID=D2RSM4_HALTV|nr:hypothetical protein [Haloterrigena turkmenica]ADB60800.1 hypothetical protein Htur_1915 [Haloterrigena turkmenica DSM 5511]
MASVTKPQWGSFAKWSATAFLVAGLLMVVDAAIVATNIVTGEEGFLVLGQAFVGAAWTGALIGLLGLYPGLADRSRWLSRAGVVFAGIGVVTFAVMAVVSLVDYVGILAGEFDSIGVFFIPGVLVGSVLGFVAFGVASLWTDAYSRTLGVLLLVPAILVATNILRFVAGLEAATLTLAIVIGDALAMLAIGYVLRSSPQLSGRLEPAPGEVRHG